MKNEFFLEDFVPFLNHTHVVLDNVFFLKLIKDASKSEIPHRDIEFAKILNCPVNSRKKSSTTIYGWMKGYRTIPFNKLSKILSLSKFSWTDLEKNIISIKSGIKHGEIKPKFPIKIDYKLGLICGHVLGDGSIDKRLHSVFFSNSNNELIEEFYNAMFDIFGIAGRLWVQDKPEYNNTKWLKRVYRIEDIPLKNNAGIFYPKICSDFLYGLFGRFAEGKEKSITSQIKHASKEFKIGLIRAFFDDEGSVDPGISGGPSLRFHQDRKDILEDIKKLLLEMGINSNPVRNYFKNKKIRYYFNITSLKNYSLYSKIIGCSSSLKKSKLDLAIARVKNTNGYKNFNDFS